MSHKQPICPRCKTAPKHGKVGYCRPCKAELQNGYNKKAGKRNIRHPPSSPGAIKEIVRARSYRLVRTGKIKKEQCESCGNPHSEIHHSDYQNPERIRWLCRKCHLNLHRMMRERDVIVV